MTQWPTLLEQLGLIRRTGLAVDREETVLGRVAVASAIHDSTERLSGCILVTGRAGRLDPEAPEVREPITAAARRLAGWRGTPVSPNRAPLQSS